MTFKTLNGKTYIEVGTGIDNIFKVLRLDFVWRLSPAPSFAGTRIQVRSIWQFPVPVLITCR